MRAQALALALLVGLGNPSASAEAPQLPYDQPPTPEHAVLQGKASWYVASYCKRHPCIPFYAAAGERLRKLVPVSYHMEPVAIRITSLKTGKSVIGYVVDWCTCTSGTPSNKTDDKLVDLSPAIFDALGIPRSRGVMRVEVEVVDESTAP